MSVDLGKSDEQFIKDLDKSRRSVFRVARYLLDVGFEVHIKPTIIRPDASQRHEYADKGDLSYVSIAKNGKTVIKRVEVKHRWNMDFTSVDDFPFPTVFVDTKYDGEGDRPAPDVVVCVNRLLTAALMLRVEDTRPHWTLATVFDSTYGRESVVYECPKQFCKALDLTQYDDLYPGVQL